MAFDSLQVPATIINNDKLVSMAGNLMAKEKADQDKREAGFINQMAKIDSSSLRQGDVNIFKEKYNDLINYGSKADLQSIEGQTEVARKLNELNAFVNISKAAKEQYDVPLSKIRFEKDFDPRSSAYIDEIIATPTDKLSGIDFNRLKRIDDKDYLSNWKIDPKEVVIIGDAKYMNPKSAYPLILSNIQENVRAKINTLDGAKGLSQYAASKGLDLSIPEKKEEAITGLAQALFDINKINFDKAITEKTPKAETEGSLKRKEKEGDVKIYFEHIWNGLKGDPSFVDYVQSQAPAGIKVEDDGYKYTFKKQAVSSNGELLWDDTAKTKPKMVDAYNPISRTQGAGNFVTNMANTLSDFGKKAGQEFIPTSSVTQYYNKYHLGKKAVPFPGSNAQKVLSKFKPKSGGFAGEEMN